MLFAFHTNLAIGGQSFLPSTVFGPSAEGVSMLTLRVSAFTPHPNFLKFQVIISNMLKFQHTERAISLIKCPVFQQ